MSITQQMIALAKNTPTIEVCGLVAGKGETATRIFPGRNLLQRSDRFRMDPRDQLDAIKRIESAGLEILAVYHSHPLGLPFPSHYDLEEHFDPAIACVLLTKHSGSWQVNAFIIRNCLWEELPLFTGV